MKKSFKTSKLACKMSERGPATLLYVSFNVGMILCPGSLKAMCNLPQKGMGKLLYPRKSKFDISPFIGNVVRFPDIVPDSQCNAEVDALVAFLREIMRMMPDMHFGAIKYVFHIFTHYKCTEQSAYHDDQGCKYPGKRSKPGISSDNQS